MDIVKFSTRDRRGIAVLFPGPATPFGRLLPRRRCSAVQPPGRKDSPLRSRSSQSAQATRSCPAFQALDRAAPPSSKAWKLPRRPRPSQDFSTSAVSAATRAAGEARMAIRTPATSSRAAALEGRDGHSRRAGRPKPPRR